MNGQNGFSQSNNWFVGLGMKINDENLQGSVEKKNGNKDHQKMFHLSLSLIGKKYLSGFLGREIFCISTGFEIKMSTMNECTD